MTDNRLQQEPSMEEILASIRRIINQDETDQNVAPGPVAAVGDVEPVNGHAPAQPVVPANGTAPANGTVPTNSHLSAGVNGQPVVNGHPVNGHMNGHDVNGASYDGAVTGYEAVNGAPIAQNSDGALVAPSMEYPTQNVGHNITQNTIAYNGIAHGGIAHNPSADHGRQPPPPGNPVTPTAYADASPATGAAPAPHQPAYADPHAVYAGNHDQPQDQQGHPLSDADMNGTAAQEDVLNLTEMVAEDGQVVSIQPTSDTLSEPGYNVYYDQQPAPDHGAYNGQEAPEGLYAKGHDVAASNTADIAAMSYQDHGQEFAADPPLATVPTHRQVPPAPVPDPAPAPASDLSMVAPDQTQVVQSPFRTDDYSPHPDGYDDDSSGSRAPAGGVDMPAALLGSTSPTRRKPPQQGQAALTPADLSLTADTDDDDEGDNRVEDRRRRPTGRIKRSNSDTFSALAGPADSVESMNPDNGENAHRADTIAHRQGTGVAAQGVNGHPYQGDSALERMVHEALTPMLRDWMDQNLRSLIEEVVREELHRMFKRRDD